MAETKHSYLAVIDYEQVAVKLSALASSLKPQGRVYYFVVNALCRLLFHRKHPKNSYKHYFFSKVGDYFIGNHGPNDSKEKELYDNVVKYFKGAGHARSLAYNQYIPNLTTIWSEVVQIDFGFHGYEVIYADVPQQTKNFSNDSGIFAMKNLELWELNVYLMDKFLEADIGHLRIKYVNDMIFNEYNSSDDGRSKVMKYDAELPMVEVHPQRWNSYQEQQPV
ncbi:unnamed protein product [Miscanthus lutarioriparius]|uniref:Uncharacterized protein n=1 Tax=Miscanthus lutarioriparius TaxID=422564 RepID=A0A811PER8_9POAL|nr:unnamed protein product [Miscanthus lutarioriparius]